MCKEFHLKLKVIWLLGSFPSDMFYFWRHVNVSVLFLMIKSIRSRFLLPGPSRSFEAVVESASGSPGTCTCVNVPVHAGFLLDIPAQRMDWIGLVHTLSPFAYVCVHELRHVMEHLCSSLMFFKSSAGFGSCLCFLKFMFFFADT